MTKILIVDDSEALLEILAFLIKRHGDEPITYYSAENIVDKVQQHKPDVIIMDVLLQGVDGRELCKEIKAIEIIKHIPIILMSASNRALEDYKECKADAIIEKPFDLPVIYDRINCVLRNKV